MNTKFVLPIAGSALSLATLWFFRAFRKLLYPSDFRYFDLEVSIWFDYAAVLTCVLLLALVLFSIAIVAEYSKNIQIKRIFHILFLMLGIASFGSLSSEIITWIEPEAKKFINLPLPFLVLAFCFVLSCFDAFGLKSMVSRLRNLAIFALPFAILLLIQTGLAWAGGGVPPLEGRAIERGVSVATDSKVHNRVVWVIFDELEMATMLARPESLKMPAMDRLMAESVVAENVYSPHADTLVSIPALLTGQPLRDAKPYSVRDLKLFGMEEDKGVALTDTANLVDDVRRLGGRVAIAGWYHPYTRLFEDEIAYGYFQQLSTRDCFGTAECVGTTFFSSLENVPGIYRILTGMGINVRWPEHKYAAAIQAPRNKYLRENAAVIASNPEIDLAFIHYPAPHWPFIDKNDEPTRGGYYASLEAVDRTLSEIRQSLTAEGEWDKTTLIVTSDHWWRHKTESDFAHVPETARAQIADDTRIPFIVKMPGQSTRVNYTPAFNSVITRYIINAILRGEVRTAGELTVWLDNMIRTKPDYANFRPEGE